MCVYSMSPDFIAFVFSLTSVAKDIQHCICIPNTGTAGTQTPQRNNIFVRVQCTRALYRYVHSSNGYCGTYSLPQNPREKKKKLSLAHRKASSISLGC